MEITEVEKLRKSQRMTIQMVIPLPQIVQSLTVRMLSPIKRTVQQTIPQMIVQPRKNQTEIAETVSPQAVTRAVRRTAIILRVKTLNSPTSRKMTS